MRDEDNLAEEFERVAAGEPITHAVIGTHYDDTYKDQPRDSDKGMLNRVLMWKDARPLLNYHYDSGFGGADCHPVYAWTASRILFVHEYDGATDVHWVPRNPQNVAPEFGGDYK